ncbi:MAG: class II aldolase/adducin family protein [Thermodesulfobacteriota bacterium]
MAKEDTKAGGAPRVMWSLRVSGLARPAKRKRNFMTDFSVYKKEVLEGALWLSERGYLGSHRGSGGNVSVRIDEGVMAITPSSLRYQAMSADDVCVVGFDLTIIDGKKGINPSVETGLHGVVYRMRPDVNAVVHTHQTYGSLFSIINTPIPALFDEVSFSLGSVIEIIPYALSGTPDLAKNVAEKVASHANAFIIQNHGILALGQTLDQAILHAELLEKAAHIYYMALSTGKPITTLPEPILALVDAVREHEVKEARK